MSEDTKAYIAHLEAEVQWLRVAFWSAFQDVRNYPKPKEAVKPE